MEVAADISGTFHPPGLGYFHDAQPACHVLHRRLAHAEYAGCVGCGLYRIEFGKQGKPVFVPFLFSHGYISFRFMKSDLFSRR